MIKIHIPHNVSNPKTLRRYQRLEAEAERMNVEIAKLKGLGFEVFMSFKAGENSLWSYTENDVGVGLCFESEYNAWRYLIIKHIDRYFFTQKL